MTYGNGGHCPENRSLGNHSLGSYSRGATARGTFSTKPLIAQSCPVNLFRFKLTLCEIIVISQLSPHVEKAPLATQDF